MRSKERIKDGNKAIHLNQKPLEIIKNLIIMSSDENDVIWDPFGGLFTTAVACLDTNRICYSAEVNKNIFETGVDRIKKHQ